MTRYARPPNKPRLPQIVLGKPDDEKFSLDEVDYWRRNPRARMVRWYGLQVLRHSLSDVIPTSLLGARVDGRLQQAHLGPVGETEDRAYFDTFAIR